MRRLFFLSLCFLPSLSFAGQRLLAPTNAPHGTSLPATCSAGDIFQKTNATSGSQWYLCESANTWVAQGGGGGSSPGGSQYDVQLNNGSGGFSGSSDLNFQSSQLNVTGKLSLSSDVTTLGRMLVGPGATDLADFFGIGTWVQGPDSYFSIPNGGSNIQAFTSRDSPDTNSNYPWGFVIKLNLDSTNNTSVIPSIIATQVGISGGPIAFNTDYTDVSAPCLFGQLHDNGSGALIQVYKPGSVGLTVDGYAGFGMTNPAYHIDNYGTANFNTTTGGVANIQLSGNGTPMGVISAISEAGAVGMNPADAQVGDIVIQNTGAGAARILFAAYNGGGAKSSGFFDLDDNFNLQNENGGVAKFDTSALSGVTRTYSFPATNSNGTFNITTANGTIKGKTAAQTVTSLNSASTGEYIIGCGLTINAVTLKTVKMQVQYNDQNNTLQTVDLFPEGLTNAVIGTAGTYLYGSPSISVTSGATINILVTQVVAGTSINYDAWGTIVQAH